MYTKLKNSIQISKTLVHVQKNIKNFDCGRMDLSALPRMNARFLAIKGKELNNIYTSFIFKAWGENALRAINDETVCLFIVKEDMPVACSMLNLDGKGVNFYPYEYRFDFGKKHSYAFALFVKEEFRGTGLAKALHLKQFEIAKNNGIECCDRFIVKDNFVPHGIARKFDYKRKEERIQIKFFTLTTVLILRTAFEKKIVDVFRASMKKILRFTSFCIKQPLAHAKDIIIAVYGVIFPKVYLLEGESRSSTKCVLRLLFIGKSNISPYYRNKFFSDGCNERFLKRTFLLRIASEFKKENTSYDIALVNGYEFSLHRLLLRPQGLSWFIPNYVVQTNETFGGMDEFRRCHNPNAHEDIRMVKKYNYEFEFTHDKKKLEMFYETMHIPYTEARYEDEKVLKPLAHFAKVFKRGGLLLLKKEGKYLAGCLVDLSKKTFHPYSVGIINGDVSLLKKEVLTALYVHYFTFASTYGYKKIDLGMSRAFLDDGVLRYKKKWNTRVSYTGKRTNFYFLKVNTLNPATKSFLLNNPFMSLEGNTLVGTVYADSFSSVDLDSVRKNYYYKGMGELRINFFNENDPVIHLVDRAAHPKASEFRKTHRVLILDAELKQAIAVAQSLGRQGIAVSCLSSNPHASSFYSKYCSERIYFKDTDNIDAYASFLMKLVQKRNYELIMPCMDASVKVISRIRGELIPYTKIASPSEKILAIVTDKIRMTQFCLMHNVPVPKTLFPRNITDIASLDGKIQYPAVVKGNNSTGARAVRYAHNREELVRHYKNLSKEQDTIMIQEFIAGEHLAFYAVCDRGEVTAYFMHQPLRSYPPMGGIPSKSRAVYCEELKKIAIKFLRQTGWSGMVGLGMHRDKKTKKFYLLDVNPRFGGTTPLAIKAGVDLPYLTYLLAVCNKKIYVSEYNQKQKYRSVFKEEILHGLRRPHMIPKLILDLLEPHVYYGFEKNDPLPFLYLARNTKWGIEKAIKKRIKNVARKHES